MAAIIDSHSPNPTLYHPTQDKGATGARGDNSATKHPNEHRYITQLGATAARRPPDVALSRLRRYRDGSLASRCPLLLGATAARRPPDVAFTPLPPLPRWLTRFAMPPPAWSYSGATSPRRRFYAASAVTAMAHSLRDAIAHADVPKRRLRGSCRS